MQHRMNYSFQIWTMPIHIKKSPLILKKKDAENRNISKKIYLAEKILDFFFQLFRKTNTP